MSLFVYLHHTIAGLSWLSAVILVQSWCAASWAEEGNIASENPSATTFNVQKRELWTTSRIQGRPDAPDSYATELAFPNIKFIEPIAMCQVPDSNRFCVATRSGKIFTFENNRSVDTTVLLVDLKKPVYGVAFHPKFSENGQLYVTNFENPSLFEARGARLSEFRATGDDKAAVDLNSEKLILAWPSGGHNGGCIRFGPDGLLYLATGDGSGIADSLLTGQDISDLSGSILRIDVDRISDGKPYAIPDDNPFVNREGARGEIWSFGHRQVWKFSFDRQKRLWAGDVGQDLWEALYLIQPGGNYGWSILEAGEPFRPDRIQGPGEILQPIVKHSHGEFRSITGGFVSYTDRLPELHGTYVYGDYDTGKIWSAKVGTDTLSNEHASIVTKNNVVAKELADTELRIVEFAQDDSGDEYIVDFVGGGIHRLIPNPTTAKASSLFPRKLSETGLFSSTQELTPAKGLIPYSVNAPLWSDGAIKERYIAIPNDSQIEMDAIFYPHRPSYSDRGWRFPNDTVLVKTFSIAMDTSNPEIRRRLETRILHFHQMPGNDDEYGAQVWNGYTYVWNEEQTDAELLEAGGGNVDLTIRDHLAENGIRHQRWHYPSRAECAICHTMGAKYILGVTTLQLNKEHDYGGHRENQLNLLSRLGILKASLPDGPDKLPALVDYRDPNQPLHLRSRAYLHANCAHCHRKWGGGNAEFELQASISLNQTGTIDAYPGQGTFGLRDPRILVPGNPERSLILKRMELDGMGRMPHIGVNLVDSAATQMLREWIISLKEPSQLEQPGALRPRQPESSKTDNNRILRLSSLLVCVLAAYLLFNRLHKATLK